MRSITHCLNKQLADICQRSVQLEELSDKLAQFLPVELAPKCQVGSFNKGCLILIAADAGWASQLRFIIPELRDKLRKDAGLYQLTSIKIAVATPTIHQEQPTATTKCALSTKAKETIISESEQCAYEPLQKALLNLATRL